MVFTHRHRRWTAWVAVWAILLGALAPTVSHGLRAWTHSTITWVEVCSSTGAKLVAIAADSGRVSFGSPIAAKADTGRGLPGGEHAGEHCPFCLLHANALALPSSPPAAVLPIRFAREALPTLFLQAPRTLFAWAPPPARGPPASV